MPEIKFGGNTATTFVEEVMMRLIVTTCNLEHPKQPTSPPSDHFHSPARSQLYPTGPGSPSKGLEILKGERVTINDEKTFEMVCAKYYEYSVRYCLNKQDRDELHTKFSE